MKPAFKHLLNTPEGRHERAVWTIREADGRHDMASVTEFLKKKGMTDNEIMAAFNEASEGEVVKAAATCPHNLLIIECMRCHK